MSETKQLSPVIYTAHPTAFEVVSLAHTIIPTNVRLTGIPSDGVNVPVAVSDTGPVYVFPTPNNPIAFRLNNKHHPFLTLSADEMSQLLMQFDIKASSNKSLELFHNHCENCANCRKFSQTTLILWNIYLRSADELNSQHGKPDYTYHAFRLADVSHAGYYYLMTAYGNDLDQLHKWLAEFIRLRAHLYKCLVAYMAAGNCTAAYESANLISHL